MSESKPEELSAEAMRKGLDFMFSIVADEAMGRFTKAFLRKFFDEWIESQKVLRSF